MLCQERFHNDTFPILIVDVVVFLLLLSIVNSDEYWGSIPEAVLT